MLICEAADAGIPSLSCITEGILRPRHASRKEILIANSVPLDWSKLSRNYHPRTVLTIGIMPGHIHKPAPWEVVSSNREP
jgi:succinyl-CoA synthetase alpha subunit